MTPDTDLSGLPPKRRRRYRLEYAAVRSVSLLANALPARMSSSTGAAIGSLIGGLWRSRRSLAEANIQRALGDALSPGDVSRIAGETFRTMGRTVFEVLRFPRTDPQSLIGRVEYTGEDYLRWAHEQGRGALLVSGHFGNWEVLGAWIRAMGYPLDVVVKPMRNPLVDRLYNECRGAMDIGVIHTQVATKGILRALQKKRFVAILADQYAGAEGIDVDFFGRPASTPRGPAALALKFGCPLMTGVLERIPGGGYRVGVDGPVTCEPTGEIETDIRNVTQEIASRLEAHIRRAPGQWLWTHRRWRD